MIESGNITTKQNGERGWIIGHFMPESSPFHSKHFEVKWLPKQKRGSRKASAKRNQTAKTLCILVRGKFRMEFPDLGKSVLLEKEGDYVFWDAGVNHTWEVIEECVNISIRWPSLPNDQR